MPETYTAAEAKIVTPVTKKVKTHEGCSTRSTTGGEGRDDIRHIWWGFSAPEEPIEDIGITLFKQFDESGLVGRRGRRVMFAQVALQHKVELTQTAPRTPAQLPDRRLPT